MKQLGMRSWAVLALTTTLVACGSSTSATDGSRNGVAGAKRPNLLVIMIDDLGYSDLGAFGGEISTPHLDQLAKQGRVLTNFHSTPLCATSRAELITGADHHLVGVGTLSESSYFYPGKEKYKGSLDDSARSIAHLLRDGGYHTYMAGKWHLGGGGPVQQGFDKSFSLDYTAAYASNFKHTADDRESAARPYFENGVEAEIPDDFFSSDAYTSKLIEYIGAGHGDGKPFFGYLAFQAVHWPLQVPDAYLDLYRGRYDAGYDVIREARLQKQKTLGLLPQDFTPAPFEQTQMTRFGAPGVTSNLDWDQLTDAQRRSEARIMEIYAGMLTNVDDNLGRLFDYLKAIGEYDNTFIVFMSDNGADGMGHGFIPYVNLENPLDRLNIDNSFDNYGKRSSFLFRSTRWAEVGNTPLRRFKSFTSEGGIGVAAIARLPGEQQGTVPNDAMTGLRDIAPTLLALAGIADPGNQYQGRSIAPLEGRSMLPLLRGQTTAIYGDDDVLAGEVNDIRFVRRGPWKATRVANYLLPSSALNVNHQWELFNLDEDRGETRDVSAMHPEILAGLIADWGAYVQRVGVLQPLLPPLLPPIDR
jgi:arylsulfatase A-like enzyme